MRDFLEGAHSHRDDGYGRVQQAMKTDLPKRFYTSAGTDSVDGGFSVTLDGRATRTPGRKVPVVVPSLALASRMADEWAGQGEYIDAQTMPTVRLVNSALESGADSIGALREEIVKYAGNDLLLYRVDTPRELVAEHERVWDEMLLRIARRFEVSFQPTIGIVHQPQPAATLARLSKSLETLELLPLTALLSITGITGSSLLAIALLSRLASAEEVWLAAHVDEDYQARQWGSVEEAVQRRAKRRREFDVAVMLLEDLMRG